MTPLEEIFAPKNMLALIDGMWEEVMLELHAITRDGDDITENVMISKIIDTPNKVVEEAAD